ncbi:MAG TPA: NUDIX hydrolase [Steroidobacteraceae bacterium]|nr:NUDIX hydrolase [Steroidobacteraceae bacterium]
MIEKITPIYTGRVLQLNVERVQLPNGTVADLEIARHPGGAAIVAVDDQRRVCMLHQFRHAADGWIWELPPGKIDNREPPLNTAQRELAEEGGMHATRWESLGHMLSSPGVFTEVVHLFYASQLTATPMSPEEHEVFKVEWRPFEEVLAMAYDGQLNDAKSLIGIFRAAPLILNRR